MGIRNRYADLAETEIHDLLRNDRRRMVITHMQRTIGRATLRELAEAIAEAETGESPPPRNIRESVYNSLHQTHLPKLDKGGIVDYDSDRKTIQLNGEARSVERYMNVVTKYGLTWDEFYRILGTTSLMIVLMSLVDVPSISAVDPIVWTSLALFGFAISMGVQLWRQRWLYLNAMFG